MAAEPAVSLTAAAPPAFVVAARVVRGLTLAVQTAGAVLFCIALAGLASDIVMRYLFSSSIRGMQEIVNLIFLWIYMFGVAALYARKGDAAITFIVRSLPVRLQIAVEVLISLVITASMLIVLTETSSLIGAQASITSAELGIPEPFRFAPLALAAASVALTSLIDIWSCVLWARTGTRPVVWPSIVPAV